MTAVRKKKTNPVPRIAEVPAAAETPAQPPQRRTGVDRRMGVEDRRHGDRRRLHLVERSATLKQILELAKAPAPPQVLPPTSLGAAETENEALQIAPQILPPLKSAPLVQAQPTVRNGVNLVDMSIICGAGWFFWSQLTGPASRSTRARTARTYSPEPEPTWTRRVRD